MPDLNIDNPSIEKNLTDVRERISTACVKYARDEAEVTLLAVSKTKPLEMVEEALKAKQQHFGENYLQDALDKITHIEDPASVWHFIGAIQSNKTSAIAAHFDWVHTVSSEKIARRLSTQRPSGLAPLNVLIQVNIDAEDSKSGVLPENSLALIRSLIPMENIVLRGLMAIPAVTSPRLLESNLLEPTHQNNAFKRLKELQLVLRTELDLPYFDQLSMGMSADLELAIAEGSTIVRIGTAIFGARAIH